MTGFILDYAKRNWQAYCIYLLLMENLDSIKHQLENNVRHKEKRLTLENFENGRERGYTIKDSSNEIEISWAENRSSDDIVVYLFPWEMANEISEEEWYKKTKWFKPQQFSEVYNFILEFLEIDLCERC